MSVRLYNWLHDLCGTDSAKLRYTTSFCCCYGFCVVVVVVLVAVSAAAAAAVGSVSL